MRTALLLPFALLCFSIRVYAQISNTVGIVGFSEFSPPAVVPGQSSWLMVPQMRQETNLCVPTSSAMALLYYGHYYPPRELKVWSRGQQYDHSQPFNDFTITYFKDLISGLKKHGIVWNPQNFSNDDEGFATGIRSIEDQIDLNRPVLIDTSLFGGHTFVVAGYDKAKDSFFIVDPNIGSPGLRILSSSELNQIWKSLKAKPVVRAAIFTAPIP